MGSTVCVRCGATLMPHLYCNVCQDVLCFVCSSCSIFTDERVHAYCHNYDADFQNTNNIQELVRIPNSSQIVLNNDYMQNQFDEEIINISTSYWNNIFESIKLTNRYWRRMFIIGNSSP
jgi:hypothetical protein